MPRSKGQSYNPGAQPSGNGGGRPPSTQQPVRVPTNQPYGQAKKLRAAQQAVPLPATPPPPRPTRAQRYDRAMELAQAAPGGEDARLAAPTRRPNEPVTAGLPFGAGPGPEAIPQITPNVGVDDLGLFLRELYRAQPSEDIRQLIIQHDASRPAVIPPSSRLLQNPNLTGSPTPPTPPLASPPTAPPAPSPLGAQAPPPEANPNAPNTQSQPQPPPATPPGQAPRPVAG